MLKCYLTVNDQLTVAEKLNEKGAWIHLIEPSEAELEQVGSELGIIPDLLRAALDEEERSRIEVDDNQLLILINIPVEAESDANISHDTVPLGIVVTENSLITVCLKDNPILGEFEANRNRSLYTFKKTRFILQILLKTATYYLRYLKQIAKRSDEIENHLHGSMKNEELIKLLSLEKSLVYFTTSLRANQIVMEKLLRSQLKNSTVKADPDTVLTSQILWMYPEDEELLEDVITENKQAIEMCATHTNILSGTMDAFASIISNNLNMVMKFLTSVTIIMALPTMVASFFGMNVPVPFANSTHAFGVIFVGTMILCICGILLLRRKNMF